MKCFAHYKSAKSKDSNKNLFDIIKKENIESYLSLFKYFQTQFKTFNCLAALQILDSCELKFSLKSTVTQTNLTSSSHYIYIPFNLNFNIFVTSLLANCFCLEFLFIIWKPLDQILLSSTWDDITVPKYLPDYERVLSAA